MDEQQHPMDTCTISPAARPSAAGELAESRLRRSAYLTLQHVSCEFRETRCAVGSFAMVMR